MALIDVVAKRRLDEEEHLRHQAFLVDIATSWHPTSLHDRLLHWRARVVHAFIQLFGGGPTLLQIAVASGLIALGMAIRGVAPAPDAASSAVAAPGWARALVVAGMLSLAFEAFRSPRRIQNRRWIAFAVAPIPLVQIWLLVASPLPDGPSWSARLGWTVGGAGIALLICAARFRNQVLLQASLTIAAAGAALLAVSEAARMVRYLRDQDPLLAAASALMLFGSTLIAGGLRRAHVKLSS